MFNISLNYVSNDYTVRLGIDFSMHLYTRMILNFSKVKLKGDEKVDHVLCFKETRYIFCLNET